MREAVVFIHGMWMTGAEMLILRRRLSQCGFDCFSYRYQSLRRSPRENATHLNQYLQEIRAEVIHLVAHSLGLGTVTVGLFDAEAAEKILGVPEGYSVVSMNPLGYPDQPFRSPKRKEVADFVHYEKF